MLNVLCHTIMEPFDLGEAAYYVLELIKVILSAIFLFHWASYNPSQSELMPTASFHLSALSSGMAFSIRSY